MPSILQRCLCLISIHILTLLSDLSSFSKAENTATTTSPCYERDPPKWPSRFTLVQRLVPSSASKMKPATTVTFYDHDLGANLIQQTPDNSTEPIFWDLELNTQKSYYFYPETKTCIERDFSVGILRMDWLDGAESIGESMGWNGREVCGWTKADFLEYYADKETMEPVSWYFHSMKASFNTIYYQPNVQVPNMEWFTPPEYCFEDEFSSNEE